jgi:RsiW-degrading membrane proteinase PrsW (M82 family)
MPPYWFLLSLLAGALALLIAALLQSSYSRIGGYADLHRGFASDEGIGSFLVTVFIRIALTEETGRILALALLLGIAGKGIIPPIRYRTAGSRATTPHGWSAATGLVAGLGFALIESASYGATDVFITLLRAFTAAPLHGACGARIGLALGIFKERPGRAFLRFFSAVILHGMYNLMVISTGIPPVIPILIAFSAFLASLHVIEASLAQ